MIPVSSSGLGFWWTNYKPTKTKAKANKTAINGGEVENGTVNSLPLELRQELSIFKFKTRVRRLVLEERGRPQD